MCTIGLMKIYTKTGDGGETSLFSGGRVGKDSPRIEAYGTVDELNSLLGLLAAEEIPKGVADQLQGVQSVLFSIGSSLADTQGRLDINENELVTDDLERWIDDMDRELDELRVFILPGGCRAAALTHVVRAVCRRAERRVVVVGEVDGAVVAYLNRLSDTLFVLARWLNAQQGVVDVEWRR